MKKFADDGQKRNYREEELKRRSKEIQNVLDLMRDLKLWDDMETVQINREKLIVGLLRDLALPNERAIIEDIISAYGELK
ncbi:hypothetical protein KAR91_62980 [Candidatus Pacearchaeota archaeon]|nr:hypothetical protein [Candidatus Pacearchaeota archaeon]